MGVCLSRPMGWTMWKGKQRGWCSDDPASLASPLRTRQPLRSQLQQKESKAAYPSQNTPPKRPWAWADSIHIGERKTWAKPDPPLPRWCHPFPDDTKAAGLGKNVCWLMQLCSSHGRATHIYLAAGLTRNVAPWGDC